MRKGIVLIVSVIAGLVIAGLAAFYVAEGFWDAMLSGRSSASSQRRLVQLSSRINAGLPRQIDQETRLDTTMAGPGNQLTYVCTLINVSGGELDATDFAAKLKPELVKSYKTLSEMAAFRKGEVELHYCYRDKVGNVITTIVVSPKDF